MPIKPDAETRPDLAAVAFEAPAAELGFTPIGDLVLPPLMVPEQSGTFKKIPVESLTELPPTKRAAKGAYPRSDYKYEEDNYTCTEDAWEELVDDSERRRLASSFDAEQLATIRAFGVVRRRREYDQLLLCQDRAGLWPVGAQTGADVVNEWDDATNATPLDDVNTGKIAIRENLGGAEANTLVIAYSTFLDLGVADDVVGRIQYTNPNVARGEINVDLLAQYFGVDRVLVSRGMYNSAIKSATYVAADLWSNEYAFLCRSYAGPDLMNPCVGRTFVWEEDAAGIIVEMYRDEPHRSDVVRVRMNTDPEIITSGAGYLLGNITT